MYIRPIEEDHIKQFQKSEYLIVLNKNRGLVKGKITAILDYQENIINGYKIQTNKTKKYISDLIKANLVEKVEE